MTEREVEEEEWEKGENMSGIGSQMPQIIGYKDKGWIPNCCFFFDPKQSRSWACELQPPHSSPFTQTDTVKKGTREREERRAEGPCDSMVLFHQHVTITPITCFISLSEATHQTHYVHFHFSTTLGHTLLPYHFFLVYTPSSSSFLCRPFTCTRPWSYVSSKY